VHGWGLQGPPRGGGAKPAPAKAGDTSEINFDRSRRPVTGLGPTGNPGIKGFFVHPVMAVDAEDEALLGVAGAENLDA
jgi:hypothetical protein